MRMREMAVTCACVHQRVARGGAGWGQRQADMAHLQIPKCVFKVFESDCIVKTANLAVNRLSGTLPIVTMGIRTTSMLIRIIEGPFPACRFLPQDI